MDTNPTLCDKYDKNYNIRQICRISWFRFYESHHVSYIFYLHTKNRPKTSLCFVFCYVDRFGRKEGKSKVLEGSMISSVVVLSEIEEIKPCEVWVHSWLVSGDKMLWGYYHFVFLWAQEKRQRYSLMLSVYYCSVHATFVYPI